MPDNNDKQLTTGELAQMYGTCDRDRSCAQGPSTQGCDAR